MCIPSSAPVDALVHGKALSLSYRATVVFEQLKGNSGRKKATLKWKSVKNAKIWALTDLNAPNGSRDIPFQNQELEQNVRRHFVDL